MNVVQNTSVAQDSNLFNDNDQIDFDTVSVSSDITFGNDTDKTMTKKYKNMNVERLREECKDKSLNTEGTKAILISRILEYNKKQK
jgi:glycerol-3-phosphate cytidylyltransferase-like family protein